ncbi:MAG: GntR family transcriptional regulator [Eubacteriales bacterium]|nr:GntR family transcriptional regulator [Eubacteriales bacterium]
MQIVLSNTSDQPIYQQIYEQLCAQIVKGELRADFCLPPIRTVAKELRISVITVKKAWEELERQGFIYTITGKGCFVAPLHLHERAGKRDDLVAERLQKDLAYYRGLGLSRQEMLELVEKYYDHP